MSLTVVNKFDDINNHFEDIDGDLRLNNDGRKMEVKDVLTEGNHLYSTLIHRFPRPLTSKIRKSRVSRPL